VVVVDVVVVVLVVVVVEVVVVVVVVGGWYMQLLSQFPVPGVTSSHCGETVEPQADSHLSVISCHWPKQSP
jgi:hypothetical protein